MAKSQGQALNSLLLRPHHDLQAEVEQHARNGTDIASTVKTLSAGLEECTRRIAAVTSNQANDMQHLKELGAQVAALWSDPSPRDSPRESDSAQVWYLACLTSSPLKHLSTPDVLIDCVSYRCRVDARGDADELSFVMTQGSSSLWKCPCSPLISVSSAGICGLTDL